MLERLKLVLATPEDLEKVNALMRASKAYWGYSEAFMKKFMDAFKMTEESIGENMTYCVYMDASCIGFFSFSKAQDHLILDNFFIQPEFIGNGYGKRMWVLVCEKVNAHGYSQFELMSDPNADGFYQKMGCTNVNTIPSPIAENRMINIYRYTSDSSN